MDWRGRAPSPALRPCPRTRCSPRWRGCMVWSGIGLRDGARELLPDRLDARKARDLERVLMQRHAADAVEMIVVQEAAAGLEEPAHRLIAGGNRGHVVEIMDCDARHREIERPADGLLPRRFTQIAQH